MKRKNVLRVILIFIFLIIAFGLWNMGVRRPVSPDSETPLITTSFYPLYFFATEVAGGKIKIENITPSSVEPHDYEPTAKDLVKIQKSKLLLILGNGFEPWGSKIKSDLGNTGTRVVEVSSGLALNKDPHTWLSFDLAKKEVEIITKEIVMIDEINADFYMNNSKNLIEKLDNLRNKYRQGLADCMESKVIVSHAAFGYLLKEFDLVQISISGINPDEEPSTKQLAEITTLAKKENIKYIFFEKLVSPKLAETIANEIGAKTLVLDPIEGIRDNDLKEGKSYMTLMEENLENLRIALACK